MQRGVARTNTSGLVRKQLQNRNAEMQHPVLWMDALNECAVKVVHVEYAQEAIRLFLASNQAVNLIGAPTTLATLVEAVGSWARATRSTQLDALEAFS